MRALNWGAITPAPITIILKEKKYKQWQETCTWFFKKLFRPIWLFETYGMIESGWPFGSLIVKIVPRTTVELSVEMIFLGCWAKTPLVALSMTVDFEVFLVELVGQGVFWAQTLLFLCVHHSPFSAVWVPHAGTPSNPQLKMSGDFPCRPTKYTLYSSTLGPANSSLLGQFREMTDPIWVAPPCSGFWKLLRWWARQS